MQAYNRLQNYYKPLYKYKKDIQVHNSKDQPLFELLLLVPLLITDYYLTENFQVVDIFSWNFHPLDHTDMPKIWGTRKCSEEFAGGSFIMRTQITPLSGEKIDVYQSFKSRWRHRDSCGQETSKQNRSCCLGGRGLFSLPLSCQSQWQQQIVPTCEPVYAEDGRWHSLLCDATWAGFWLKYRAT